MIIKRWNLKGQKHTHLHSLVNPRRQEMKCGEASWGLKTMTQLIV